jgi:VanZ family protein
VSRSRFAPLTILYALFIAYASTIVGVLGPHYVSIAPSEALYRLIHMPYVANGSDQRSDWMGNLVMLVPMGFLVAGWLTPRQSREGQTISTPVAAAGFLLCLAFILAVKYAQLFFPPRTVTLNYVVAQSLGAIAGIALFGVTRSPLAEASRDFGRLESLRLLLRLYAGLLILFMLMPLDFALNTEDVTRQLNKLPDTFTALNGEGRPFLVRAAVVLASMAGTAPIGALLTLMGRGRIYVGRSTGAATWIGCFAMIVVYAASALVMSGSASLPSVGFRTAGIAFGAWFMHWLTRQDPDQIRHELGALVPWAVPFYLVALFAVNGLLSFHWTTPGDAARDFYNLGLLPLFNYYIVTKAQAAKNIVGHAVMYAPIGIMIWLRATNGEGGKTAFTLAALLSAIVETGRFLRPGLVPDINAVPLAGIAAWGAAALMPLLWQMLSAVAIGRSLPLAASAPAVNWRDRDTARRTRRRAPVEDRPEASGDIEHY